MTEASTSRRPLACRYDRALGERVTRGHRDDCPDPGDHRACMPCTAPHCVVCGHEHASNANPITCPGCLLKATEDLATIPPAYTALSIEALAGGRDGRLVAAAPIPGGTAAVLIGPTVRLDVVKVSRWMSSDHKAGDPIPPLAILAQWEDIWRTWLDHTTHQRATVASSVGYLVNQLEYMAQQSGPGVPDWVAFTRQVRDLRSRLEHALHDEREPERGVECFECGDRLVRRVRSRRMCRHKTAAREWFTTMLSYPELRVYPTEVAAARAPCEKCSQGGVDNPAAGMSWECPGCRKEYSPGEYATAVRRDLLERGMEGDGWTHITIAAEAASTLTGHELPASTLRQWIVRDKVASKLSEQGARLVFWPDVADEAVAAVQRALKAADARRRRAKRDAEQESA